MNEILLIRATGKGMTALPLGLMSIYSYLKKHGIDSRIYDAYTANISLSEMIQQMPNLKYIGISAMTIQLKNAIQIITELRKKTNAKIIIGGTHATALPNQLTKYADHIVIGEGEVIFKEIVQNKHKNKKIIKGIPIQDLNEIPLMTSKEIKEQGLFKEREEYYIATSRGCPYNCNFCLSKEQRIPGMRYIKIDSIITQIKDIVTNLNIKRIMITDDIFIIDQNRVRDFCNKIIQQKIKVQLSGFTHAGHGNIELYKLMKKAGFYRISIGIEHGTNELLKYCGKKTTLTEIEETCRQIYTAGLVIGATYILGNIPETNESISATVDFAIKLHKKYNTESWFSFAQPLPGSPMFTEVKKSGKIIERDYSKWYNYSLVYIPEKVDITHIIKERERGMRRANKFQFTTQNILYRLKEFSKLENIFK